jgi:hypothetical protein
VGFQAEGEDGDADEEHRYHANHLTKTRSFNLKGNYQDKSESPNGKMMSHPFINKR